MTFCGTKVCKEAPINETLGLNQLADCNTDIKCNGHSDCENDGYCVALYSYCGLVF